MRQRRATGERGGTYVGAAQHGEDRPFGSEPVEQTGAAIPACGRDGGRPNAVGPGGHLLLANSSDVRNATLLIRHRRTGRGKPALDRRSGSVGASPGCGHGDIRTVVEHGQTGFQRAGVAAKPQPSHLPGRGAGSGVRVGRCPFSLRQGTRLVVIVETGFVILSEAIMGVQLSLIVSRKGSARVHTRRISHHPLVEAHRDVVAGACGAPQWHERLLRAVPARPYSQPFRAAGVSIEVDVADTTDLDTVRSDHGPGMCGEFLESFKSESHAPSIPAAPTSGGADSCWHLWCAGICDDLR